MKNKRQFKNCTEKSTKIEKWWIKEMRIQLENSNENSIRKWKFNLKMEMKILLKIGKKVHGNNGN